MVLGVGLFVFWANSTDPDGLPPFDGQFVAGRWRALQGSNASSSWLQNKILTWSPVVQIEAEAVTTIRIPIAGDTLLNMGMGSDGQKLVLELVQDAMGYHSITLGNKFHFGTDFTSITFSILPGSTDYVGLIYNSPTDQWRVVAYSRGF
jgi:hypothetical protein